MQRLLILFSVLFVQSQSFFSQNDSVALYGPYVDGIFLSFDDFRHHAFISKAEIETKLDKTQLEFVSKALAEKELVFAQSGSEKRIACKEVWGYFQNNTFYINYRGDFYRVPVFGSFSYFVATVIVSNTGLYNPQFGGTMMGTTTREVHEFMMDAKDGILRELSLDAATRIFQRDADLYAEFHKLTKRKQKDQLYLFIRKYNQRNGLYFLR